MEPALRSEPMTSGPSPVGLAGALTLLFAAALLAYAPSFHAPFTFDDGRYIRPDLLEAAWPPSKLTNRPLVHVTLFANHEYGGLSVIGYHAFNFGVHCLAAAFLFGLVRRTLLLPRFQWRFSAWEAAGLGLATTAVWTLHPLCTQAVTYVIQRCESMMGAAYLALLYFLLRATRTSGLGALLWGTLAVVAVWAGMLSKEVMATAPFVALAFDRVFLAESWRELLRRRWLLYLALLTPLLWFIPSLGPSFTSTTASMGFAYEKVSPLEYAQTQPGVILHYLRLSFLPHPLCLDYRWPVSTSWLVIVPTSLAVAGLVGASLYALSRRHPAGFLGFAFFGILAPTSTIVPIADLACEHRVYVPLAALVALVVVGGFSLVRHEARRAAWPPAALGLSVTLTLIILLLALGWRTYERNLDYRFPVRLHTSSLAVNPENPRAFSMLGQAFQRRGEHEAAIACFRRALEFDPTHDTAWYHLGLSFQEIDQEAAAVRAYERALEGRPNLAEAHNNLGRLALLRGETETAVSHLRDALEFEPERRDARFNLAAALERLERWPEAAAEFELLHRDHPRFAQGILQLSLLRATAPEESVRAPDDAIALADELVTLVPDSLVAWECLATARAAAERFGDAREALRHAMELARTQRATAAVMDRLKGRDELIVGRVLPHEEPWRQATNSPGGD